MSQMLPSEIWLTQILPRLQVSSLVTFGSVCKHWHALAGDDLVWRDHAIADFHLVHSYHGNHGWKDFYVRLLDSVVYTWGENSAFRLGHSQGRIGRQSRVFHTAIPQKVNTLSNQAIAVITSGHSSFHALDGYGKIRILTKASIIMEP
ncbi:hypothetical protein PHYBLDRAFT_159626 [Phycomyces blakesleeanus NRRL 1555(-)]|uniref:F-box domain-containing protein n=1 Tax=Phycomyces blakesleeanus (strain ATCC 8743b / DSM 1359 / FGSC 10004 / NBRC 33097 / NRRL 1555) TaxID=763407 RepID=A0A162TQE6_PHYB8|nr:hypothetical protein PHYBLDRAFT_159626 [Phycomyces blakesleeanus NRRL 1555(-)]OAD70242.1 hypothetical protein PHYBLDRAFT_159626 [Phycomyces blakesleeanus NRRL 1555(-)]|eukprot:XP_018288282.1 hypothetical protein PHYBLDRAFT_159626 [Phycomyces blakesleeanus NRRL 1555(-)]